MLNDDISSPAAMRLLHRPDLDPLSLDRRRFLQLIGAGATVGMLGGTSSSLFEQFGMAQSVEAAGSGADSVLVVIGLYGGNNGLNTVVPITDGHYYDQHGALAVPAESTLPLDHESGFHPALSVLRKFWAAGQLAIVEGVGYPNPNFSHFTSMATWMSGDTATGPKSGWIGRWLDAHLNGNDDLLVAAEIGHELPLHLTGVRHRATALPVGQPAFGASADERFSRIEDTVRSLRSGASGSWHAEIEQTLRDQIDVARQLAPTLPANLTLPTSPLAAKLEVAARLINANLGFRVLNAGLDNFDHHAEQPLHHETRMRELNAGLERFYDTLSPAAAARVTVMTFSEFGRTSWSNDGEGTDHGSAAPHFVLGPAVRGGRYGARPSIRGLARWERMDHHVDFRDYYGTMIDDWLGGDSSQVLGSTRKSLGIFTTGPGSGPTFPATTLGAFTSMSPRRIYDTRNGTGGATGKIGPGRSVIVPIVGVHGIPEEGVSAVALNITSIRPTMQTFLTTYPTGFTKPATSTVNPIVGQVVPNMAIVGVAQHGSITIYNENGEVDVAVDIMGFFSTAESSLFTPLTPHRILDTRKGVGVTAGKAVAGRTIRLAVEGRGGVPASGVDAVVLNLGSAAPTSNGWVTAWPTGEGKPVVSNLTYRRGEVVPNMVVCKVGPDGMVALEPSSADLHLIGDVVGYFGARGSRLTPTAPARLLDTRTGVGAPKQQVGAGRTIALQVRGRGGVAANATAVVMNVTGVRPTQQTFLTIHPSGEKRPTAASLNPGAGSIASNLVVAKIGDDGKVALYNDAGALHLLVDVAGYFVD
jgi:uncharacterized protein (DUF1501 family)